MGPSDRRRLLDGRDVLQKTVSGLLVAMIISIVGAVGVLVWNNVTGGALISAMRGVTKDELNASLSKLENVAAKNIQPIEMNWVNNDQGVYDQKNNTTKFESICKGRTVISGACDLFEGNTPLLTSSARYGQGDSEYICVYSGKPIRVVVTAWCVSSDKFVAIR